MLSNAIRENFRIYSIKHFPIGILGQVWYLIVLIPDLCTLTYFYTYGRIISIVFECWAHTKNQLFQKVILLHIKLKGMKRRMHEVGLWAQKSFVSQKLVIVYQIKRNIENNMQVVHMVVEWRWTLHVKMMSTWSVGF